MSGIVEQDLERRAAEIARRMKALGRKIETGDESEILVWIIPGALACSHRPLRHNQIWGGSGRNLSREATPLLLEWVDQVREAGIRSILCLMHDKELSYYSALELNAPDLIGFYRARGLSTERVPWEDPAYSKTSRDATRKTLLRVREDAFRTFQAMEKPVLLHCSAGIDRSAPVAAYIEARYQQ